MRFATAVPCILAAALFLSAPAQADAQNYFSVVQKTYKVEVEYWFFDRTLEVVWHLSSLSRRRILRVKVSLSKSGPLEVR